MESKTELFIKQSEFIHARLCGKFIAKSDAVVKGADAKMEPTMRLVLFPKSQQEFVVVITDYRAPSGHYRRPCRIMRLGDSFRDFHVGAQQMLIC